MSKLMVALIVVLCTVGELFSQKLTLKPPVKARVAPVLREDQNRSSYLVQLSDSTAFFSWLNQTDRGWHVQRLKHMIYRISGADGNFLNLLKSANGVSFIDRANRSAKEETVLGDFDMSLNSVTALHSRYPLLRGENMVVSIKEKPFDQHDLDLRGRVVLNAAFDEPASAHATFMATISVGGGNTSSYGKGVAWGAQVTTADFEYLLPDNSAALLAGNVSVQNHSYGVGIENYYGIESKEYDLSCSQFPTFLHVFSSGNEGEAASAEGNYSGITGYANLTGQFKTSKNTLSVGSADRYGNVVSRSSKGPAHDGRIKPELIAFGDAGSSEAAAVVSGIALVVQEAYKAIHGMLPDAALVKAVLINSADDSGRPHVDFDSGYGNVNALRAIRTIQEGNIKTGTLHGNDELVFTLEVPEETQVLKVTLAWSDPPAEPFTAKALVNDLDISLYHVQRAQEWLPWVLDTSPAVANLQAPAQRGYDRLNNAEQVTIASPSPGTYEIRVRGYDVPQVPQSFYVVYETASGFEWITPQEKDPFQSSAVNFLRWQWHGEPATGILEYKLHHEDQWHPISPSVALHNRYFEWEAPNITGLITFRMTVMGEAFVSPTVPISRAERLHVGYQCDHEIMFFWKSIPAASGYDLYQMGDRYLEPILFTADTFATIKTSTSKTNYYTVVPVFANQSGPQGATIDYQLQGVGCYFKAFLPRKKVATHSGVFDVMLGTTYNLQSAILERFNNGVFEAVQELRPVTTNNFVFTDDVFRTGSNTYRVRLVTNDALSVFSQEENILYVGEESLFIFPNPVSRGTEATIITQDEGVTSILLLDSSGRVIKTTEGFGTTKAISTDSLTRGVYIVQIQHQNGKVLSGRLLIL